MKTGMTYAESLARAIPITDDKLLKLVKVYSILMSCMHIALWTRLDIFTTCVVLVQYQNSPSNIHFEVPKQMVGYHCLHPDLPLVFDRSCFANNVLGAFDVYIKQFDTNTFNLPGPDSYHVANVQLLHTGHHAHSCSVASMHAYHPNDTMLQVPPKMSPTSRYFGYSFHRSTMTIHSACCSRCFYSQHN
jgi:hypothetical protein